MTNEEQRIFNFCKVWKAGSGNGEVIHAYNGIELTTDDIMSVLGILAEQRMLCDLYRKEALGRAESNAAEYMAQHDLT